MTKQMPNPSILPGERLLLVDMGAAAGSQPDEFVAHFDKKARALSALGGLSGNCRAVDIVGLLDRESYEKITAAVNNAAADDSVDAIVLRIDSPGGAAMGVLGTAQAIRDAKASKPVIAWFDSICCSGAYWLASQATAIYASDPMSHVGSIGTYFILDDSTKFFESFGIKRHLVSTGGAKGSGTPGTLVSDALLANAQELVTDIQTHFNAAISGGRKLSLDITQGLADGTVWSAETAQEKGLIDGVVGWPEFTQFLEKGAKMMKIATIAELREACPSADDGFILGMLESGASVEVAKSSWAIVERERKKNGESTKGGNQVLPAPNLKNNSAARRTIDGEEVSVDDATDFMAAVNQYIADHNCSRAQAVAAVGRRNPEAHRAAVLAGNGDTYTHRLIDQRFGM